MSKLIQLSNWWQRPNDAVVAITSNELITFNAFQSKVSAWVALLETCPGQKFAVFHHDAAEFLAIVCALWQLSRTACIASDPLLGTVHKLSTYVDGFIGEFNVQQAIQLSSSNAIFPVVTWLPIQKQHVAIEVYTSGTTGEPKAIQKTMQELEMELKALDSLKPEICPHLVIATVSHQHLYGMTFRLFRPFVYSIPFTTFISEYLEDVLAQAKDMGMFSLVSSPAHLGRFNRHLDWAQVKDQCVEVISSAAPLNRKDSLLVSQHLEAQVIEIYGSSETGAMAWRTQQASANDALWQPLDYLRLSPTLDGTLYVEHKTNNKVLTLADKVSFNEYGQFSLHGRADQIAKVEGKRVSLAEIEHVLNQSPWISEAKALTLTSQRVEVGAVIVLSELGLALLNTEGRKTLIKQLKIYLTDFFETIVIPRRWRFVSQLPYNSQGKLSKQQLTDLFAEQAPKWPEIVSVQSANEETSVKCLLPASLIYFDGHFDQQAILPGVVQVHWAAHFGKQYLKFLGQFKHLENLKFQQIILPEQVIDLVLRYDESNQKLIFRYESARGIHSSGRVCYE
jgi:acyl-CoA synthetase (AMP-forming)/AMP-acid ligase II